MSTNTSFSFLCLFSICIISLFSSCANKSQVEIDHSFEVAFTTEEPIKKWNQTEFESFNDLNLGFYKGYLSIKLEVTNTDKAESFMVINNDFFNRNYRFYKRDNLNGQFRSMFHLQDSSSQDARTFNTAMPNFKLDLLENETATFLITTYSDGRFIDATPEILGLTEYSLLINYNTTTRIIFFAIILLLLFVNLFQWSLVKRRIYFYYIFYMLSTFFMYLGLEGYLHNLGLKHIVIDHIVFLSVRVWFFTLLVYTSSFLEIKTIAPLYHKFLHLFILIVLGGTTVYQLIFYKTSIGNLHFFDNTLSFVWLLLILIMVILSAKKKRMELKYYLIPLVSFLLFTVIGLINGHFQILSGSPFLYIKMGTIIEFIGFTYCIARMVRKQINQIDPLQDDQVKIQQQKEAISSIEEIEKKVTSRKSPIKKTDLISVFKLLENSLSNESDWEEFKLKLDELAPNFFENLLDKHPNLSKSEIRLLILFKVGYNQKQIAAILGIEPNSVKKSKHRTRKKLNLSQSIILKDYLLNF